MGKKAAVGPGPDGIPWVGLGDGTDLRLGDAAASFEDGPAPGQECRALVSPWCRGREALRGSRRAVSSPVREALRGRGGRR